MVLPSSHSYPGLTTLFPHSLVEEHGEPGTGQIKPVSIVQVELQPSPLFVLWSSQASPESSLPFPQI